MAAKRPTNDPDLRVLTKRELNRALLQRQRLSRRVRVGAAQLVEHLVGMQAQAPRSCYTGLWSRIAGFDPMELDDLVRRRELVRISLQRSTIHLVTSRDCIELRAFTHAVQGASRHRKERAAAGVDDAELARRGRALLEATPMTFSELGAELRGRWPRCDPQSLAMGVREFVPLVQVPPRGLWREGGEARHAPADGFLHRDFREGGDVDVEHIALRYLAAYGPASTKDLQTWSGVTRLAPVVAALLAAGRIVQYADEAGATLHDVPDGALPSGDTAAPARLLAEFDDVLLSHADRARVLHPDHKSMITLSNGLKPTFLVDGFVAGTWARSGTARRATVELTHFAPLTRAQRGELEAEGESLLEMWHPGADDRVVRFVQA